MALMQRASFAAGALLSVLFVGPALGAVVTWKVSDGGNGHAYELVGNYDDPTQRWNWETSKAMAESRTYLGVSGHLVSITSAAEQQFLIDAFHNASPLPTWIGLTDSEVFGGSESFGQPNPQTDGWVWVTGETVAFTAWVPNGPDGSFDREEDFALMGSQHRDHHLWNDEQSGTGGDAQFFVEYDLAVPEPTSWFSWCVSAAAAGTFLRRRRRVDCRLNYGTDALGRAARPFARRRRQLARGASCRYGRHRKQYPRAYLQCGRGRSAAEGLGAGPRQAPDRDASMWPRPISRGRYPAWPTLARC